jgi:hypothetical protein
VRSLPQDQNPEAGRGWPEGGHRQARSPKPTKPRPRSPSRRAAVNRSTIPDRHCRRRHHSPVNIATPEDIATMQAELLRLIDGADRGG